LNTFFFSTSPIHEICRTVPQVGWFIKANSRAAFCWPAGGSLRPSNWPYGYNLPRNLDLGVRWYKFSILPICYLKWVDLLSQVERVWVGLTIWTKEFLQLNLRTYLLTYGAEPVLRSCQLCSHSRTSQHFMEPEGSLPCAQEPSTGP
jgi:hypothetical protein